MKKFLKIAAVVVVAVPILATGWLSYSAERNRARATESAVAALASNDSVQIDVGDWVVMRPTDMPPTTGVIVYPGAYCDIRGYTPVLRQVAAAGYMVVGVSMPFDFAIFAPNRASAVVEAYPEIDKWVLIGHSMGGAMAGRYAHLYPENLDGLLLWDAYPPQSNSLADTALPVMHIHRAKPDGTPPDKFQQMQELFPKSSQWVPIPGGLHMYFGSFDGGSYEEEWEAGIARDRQQRLVVAATLDWLKSI